MQTVQTKPLFYIDGQELYEILVSVLAISLAFTIAFTGLDSMFRFPKDFLVFVALSVVTIGSGFVFHEMGHKVVAIYYGAYARFQMWTMGLVVMLITSLMGFLLAAPGAVMIYSQRITRQQYGLISLAGPFVNMLIIMVFLFLSVIAPRPIYFAFDTSFLLPVLGTPVFEVWRFGAYLNFVLCLFNMLPVFPLDGSKVFAWSKPFWFAFVAAMFLFGIGTGLVSLFFGISWLFMLVVVSIISMLLFGSRRG